MYYSLEPPYFLLIAGLLASLTSGAAFAATLKQIVQKWSSDRDGATTEGVSKTVARLSTEQLLVPFLGISAGVCIFLSAGLEIFGFPTWLSYAVSVPLTILIGLLIWLQLGSMMAFVEQRGFQALDLDSFS